MQIELSSLNAFRHRGGVAKLASDIGLRDIAVVQYTTLNSRRHVMSYFFHGPVSADPWNGT